MTAQPPETGTVRRMLTVKNESGLHARPSAVLAECAKRYDAKIELMLASVPEDLGVPIGTRVDAKSVMDLLFLAAPCGTTLELEALGVDAAEAAASIEALFENEFGVIS